MRKQDIKVIPKGGNSRSFQTVDEVSRTSKPTLKHEVAVGVLTQHLTNLEIELANKQRMLNEAMKTEGIQSSVIHFSGIKIRVLKIEIKQVKRSIKVLEKRNKPLERSNYDWARTSDPI